ncbi:hypothetical protein [Clostridium sp. HBUAS56010]|uniref:hypothetical protein n=1 Tax=Clostridium sp. HBUAS56010 TaxID=2571127 RepID=UPI001177C7A5|nr:hypothetical protein [Clostridium sp. HBUAS56010]
MLERGKLNREAVEFVNTDLLVPQAHLLRKIDSGVDFGCIYEFVEGTLFPPYFSFFCVIIFLHT